MPKQSDGFDRRRVNGAQRKALSAAELRDFVIKYARPAQKGVEPNDRRYDRDAERRVSRLGPIEFDRLLRDDED